MKLKRTKQCEKCPWRKDVDPHDIPNGYCPTKHAALKDTIADKDAPLFPGAGPLRIMACHESGGTSWLVSFAASISRDGGVAVGAKDFETARRIVSREGGLHGRHGPLCSMLSPIPVDVVYFQEWHESLATASTCATQECDDIRPGLIAIAPRSIGRLSTIDIVLAGSQLALSDFGLLPLETPPFLRRWLETMGVSQLASAGFTARRSAMKTFAVRAELIERLREEAASASLHPLIIAQTHCIGWLVNQLGPGNNIGLRISMHNCESLNRVKTVGDQHSTFKETLPT